MLKPTPLIPQEIYLIERYSSLDYFAEMRDAFEQCVKAAENALAEFMRHLPPDYRSRPLCDQPDAVWGELVIPNLQYSLRGVFNGFILLSHGDYEGLSLAGNVITSFNGVNRDYSIDWMSKSFYDQYEQNERIARRRASNIFPTQQGNWEIGTLSYGYTDNDRGLLNAPPSWPIYRLNHAVTVKTGDKVPQNGVYLPDAPNSAAQFLIKDYEAWEANVQPTPEILEYGYFKNPTERQACTWTLVERVADFGGGTGCGPQDITRSGSSMRPNVPAGTACPESGWWFTPVQAASRRYFKAGDTLPALSGDYGQTFWQWSPDQSAPSLS